ncbi:hypothetical protein MMC26_003296 [Xylographa opegraphella]|nr:hypothetical protein [Xylographa opegraphella]
MLERVSSIDLPFYTQGRIVYHVVPAAARTTKFLWVPPRFVTPIFVVCDIIALLTQLYGAVIVSGTQVTDPDAASKFAHGKEVVLIGLGIQVACFGLFSIIAIRFHFTSKRFAETFNQRMGGVPRDPYFVAGGQKRKFKRDWETLLWVVNAACVLVLVRTVYRICDFALGKTGYIEENEWCAYVFDAVPMLPCIALFIYYHPAVYLPYLGFRLPKHVRQNQADYMASNVEMSR